MDKKESVLFHQEDEGNRFFFILFLNIYFESAHTDFYEQRVKAHIYSLSQVFPLILWGRKLLNEHGVSKAKEAVLFLNGDLVCMHDFFFGCEGGNQHE